MRAPRGAGRDGRSEKDGRHRIDDRSRYVLGWSHDAKIAALQSRLRVLETPHRARRFYAPVALMALRRSGVTEIKRVSEHAGFRFDPALARCDEGPGVGEPGLQVQWAAQPAGTQRLTVTAKSLARGVWIDFGELDASVFDHAFDLAHGETVTVTVTSQATVADVQRAVSVRSLYGAANTRSTPAKPASTPSPTPPCGARSPRAAVASASRRALELHRRFKFGFYDALIVAAALEAGCRRLPTEDLQHGQCIEQLVIENPFV